MRHFENWAVQKVVEIPEALNTLRFFSVSNGVNLETLMSYLYLHVKEPFFLYISLPYSLFLPAVNGKRPDLVEIF